MTVSAPRLPFAAATPTRPAVKKFNLSTGISRKAHRVLIYGTGGIGKTTLASQAPNPIFADLELGSEDQSIARIDNIDSWAELLSWLQTYDFSKYQSVVIDTVTAAESLCAKHVIENYRTDKGNSVTSIEGFGWGKGYMFMFEEWKKLLSALDRIYSASKNIVLVAHDRTGNVPNPNGDDWTRYEPRLLHNKQVSLMYATKEWCDHVLFVSYDVISADGKAKGSGTKTIYSQETATYMAKSRKLQGRQIIFRKETNELWDRLLEPVAGSDDLPPA